MRRISSTASSRVAAISWCIAVGIVAFDEVGRPAAAAQELFELLVLDAGEDRRIADLVAVEMQDRQHRAVGDWVEKLVGLPSRGERAGFGFAVADDAGDDQLGLSKAAPNAWLSE